MNFSQKLLTELKEAHGLPSDYKAGLVLGISKQTISNVNIGRNQFSDPTLVKIANILGLDPIKTVANKHIETEESEEMRLFWGQVLHDHETATAPEIPDIQAEKVA